jgi:hypothetical protein
MQPLKVACNFGFIVTLDVQKCCMRENNSDAVVAVAKQRTDGGVSVQIARDVNDRFEAWCSKRLRIKRATVTRLIERLMAAEPAVQTAMLGEVDEGLEPDYARALEALARELQAKGDAAHGKGNPGGGKSRVKLPGAVRTATGVEFREPKGT